MREEQDVNVAEVVTKQADEYDRLINEYKEKISVISDENVLLEEEKLCIEKINENAEHIKNVKYSLPDQVTFRGENYSRNDVCKKVLYFLNKMETGWQYTLGLFDLLDFWRSKNPSDVSYYVYDSTLRILGQIKYTGYNEFKDILTANSMFTAAHNEYMLDITRTEYYAALHNVVITRMQEIESMESPIN